jgi:hypothetical protein
LYAGEAGKRAPVLGLQSFRTGSSLQDTGQIAAAAAAAAACAAAPATPGLSSSSIPALPVVPFLCHDWTAVTTRASAPGTFRARYCHAYPPDVFLAAVRANPSVLSVSRTTGWEHSTAAAPLPPPPRGGQEEEGGCRAAAAEPSADRHGKWRVISATSNVALPAAAAALTAAVVWFVVRRYA